MAIRLHNGVQEANQKPAHNSSRLFLFLLADKGLPVTTGPICVCKRLTGFNCAGCGMTRSFSACLRFDFYSAMQYNLMGIPLLLGIMIYTFLSGCRYWSGL